MQHSAYHTHGRLRKMNLMDYSRNRDRKSMGLAYCAITLLTQTAFSETRIEDVPPLSNTTRKIIQYNYQEDEGDIHSSLHN